MAEMSSRKASSPPAEAPMPTMRTAAVTAIFVGGTGRFDGTRVAIASFRDTRLRVEAAAERIRLGAHPFRPADQTCTEVTNRGYALVSDLATIRLVIAYLASCSA